MSETDLSLREWIEKLIERVGQGDFWWALAAAGLISAAALLLLLILRFLFGRISKRIESWRGTVIGPVRFQRQEVLSAEETTNLATGFVRLVAASTYLLLAYVYLNAVFKLFPATASIADQLIGHLMNAAGTILSSVAGYLPSLIFLGVLFALGRWVIHIERLIFSGLAIKRIHISGFDAEWAWPTFKIVRFLTITFFLVVAFPYLPGSTSPAFQAVSVFVGVLVSLGSSGAVADVVSGVVLTYTRAFHMGDRVRIADAEGDILEKTLFVTRIRTPKNVDITIPNALVMSNHIINFSAQARTGRLVLHTTVTIGYDVSPETVSALLVEAAKETKGILDTSEPFVLQNSLDDFYVHYELNAATNDAKGMSNTYSELHGRILAKFHEAGIEIASPHLSSVRDGNPVQIPDTYLPKDYKPAAFRILPLRALRAANPPSSDD